jgi:hypothetical protein
MSIDLNIEKVLENWSPANAIREFLSNAIDEHILQNIKENPSIKLENDVISITDKGRGIINDNFVFTQNTEKVNSENTIGQFGYGLKDAIAFLEDNGYRVTITTKQYIYNFNLKNKTSTDIKAYHAFFNQSNIDMIGTKITIDNCTEKIFNEVKSVFIHYNGIEPLYETKKGNIYRTLEKPSKIYVRGLQVATNDKYKYTYNITTKNKQIKCSMNRERKELNVSCYYSSIISIITSVKSPFIEKLVEIYTSGDKIPDDLNYALVKAFISKHIPNKVSLSHEEVLENPSMVDELRSKGNYIMIDHKDDIKEATIESLKIGAVYNTMREHIDLPTVVEPLIKYENLDDFEKCNYKKTVDFIKSSKSIPYKGEEILIVNACIICRGEKALGLFFQENIYISRHILKNEEQLLGTLIHEIIHSSSGEDDVTRGFESALTDVIGKLSHELMYKNDT